MCGWLVRLQIQDLQRCENLRFSGLHTSTLPHTAKGHLSPGAWLVSWGAAGKYHFSSALLLGSLERQAFIFSFPRSTNPPPTFLTNVMMIHIVLPIFAQTGVIKQRQCPCDSNISRATFSPAIPEWVIRNPSPSLKFLVHFGNVFLPVSTHQWNSLLVLEDSAKVNHHQPTHFSIQPTVQLSCTLR